MRRRNRWGRLVFVGLLAGSCRGVTQAPATLWPTGDVHVVAPDGDDAGPGTVLAPWRSLQKAADTVRPNETVFLRSGVYPAGARFATSGTRDAPIVLRNFPGERPIIDGRGRQATGLVLDGVEFVTVRGIEVRGIGAVGRPPRSLWGAILLKDTRHCLAEANVLKPGDADGRPEGWIGAPGIQLWSDSPARGCRRNTFRGNDSAHGFSGAHVLGPASENVFEGNRFHDNQETAGDSDGAGQDNIARSDASIVDKTPYNPTRSVYRFNVFAGNADDGLDMWTSTDNVVEYNLSSGNGWGPGDGMGYKMGPGGGNRVSHCLALGNRVAAFADNSGSANVWTNNVAFRNGRIDERREGNRFVRSEEAWQRDEVREHVEATIEAFRQGLWERVPPGPPRDITRVGRQLSWQAPLPAADGDHAAYYLVFDGGRIIGVTNRTSFDVSALTVTAAAITVVAVDDSYHDNRSAPGSVRGSR